MFLGLLIGACLVVVPMTLAAGTGVLDRLLIRLSQVFPGPGDRPASGTAVTLPPAWTATPSRGPVPPAASPTREPTATPDPINLDYLAAEAKHLGHERDWAGCVLAWDNILRSYPGHGEGYFLRSICYMEMAREQRSFGGYEEYIGQALEDIDTAISSDDDVTGDYYYQRYRVYDNLMGAEGSAEQRLSFSRLGLENLQWALAAGVGSPTAHRSLPISLVAAGKCTEGLAEARRLLDAIEPGDSPSASVNWMMALAYRCLGRYEDALRSIRAAQAISGASSWRYDEAVILYSLRRLDEARAALDDSISANPYFAGYRYYLRALIHFDQGNPGLAEEDLVIGAGNVWGIDQIGALVAGLLARDAGRDDEAVSQLSWAVASLDHTNQVCLDRAVEELRGVGVEPPSTTPESAVVATPMPTVTSPPPGGVWATPVAYRKVYDYGSDFIDLGPGGHFSIHFVPGTAIEVLDATGLTIGIEFDGELRPSDLKIYVWQPRTNIWTMFGFEGGPIRVGNPARFVLPDGSLVLSPYESGDGHSVLAVRVRVELRLADGSLMTQGVP